MMGLKEFVTIEMVCFRPYPQYSIIPSFHSDAKNSSQLKKLNVRWGKDFPGRLMTVLELFAKEVNFHD